MELEFSTVEGILSRWLPLEEAPVGQLEVTQLKELALDVEDEIVRLFPDLNTRIASGSLRGRTVARVVASATMRLFKIGGDYRSSFSEAEGGFSISGSISRGKSTHLLNPEEVEMLSPGVGGGKAFTIPARRLNWTRPAVL